MRIRHLLPCWRPMLRLSESRQCSSGSNALQFNDIRATAKRPPEPARVRQKAISRCTHSAHDARQPIENKCEPAQLIMAQTQRPFSNDRFAALSDLRALCSMCHNGLAAVIRRAWSEWLLAISHISRDIRLNPTPLARVPSQSRWWGGVRARNYP